MIVRVLVLYNTGKVLFSASTFTHFFQSGTSMRTAQTTPARIYHNLWKDSVGYSKYKGNGNKIYAFPISP